MNKLNQRLGYLILRLAMGVNLLIHGAGRFGDNYQKFVDALLKQFSGTILPVWSVEAFARSVPVLEALIGALLLVGYATRAVSVFGALLMISLIFGSSLLQSWEIVGLQMNYVLFYFLLIVLAEWNHYSIDGWIVQKSES